MRGRRTIIGLAQSAVPPRVSWVVAGLAVAVAVGMHLVVWGMDQMGITTGRTRLDGYARTFEILPMWLLIGGTLHQFAARVVQAWDDVKQWAPRTDRSADDHGAPRGRSRAETLRVSEKDAALINRETL